MSLHALRPKVSVLIPTHNREHFILSAVRSALDQSYQNLEVIVGVNGCTDGTEALVRAIENPQLVIEVRDPLVSMYDNFNALLHRANGEFILILSDDDVLLPDAISDLVAALELTGARMAFGATRVVFHRGGFKDPSREKEATLDWLKLIQRYLRLDLSVYPCSTLLPRRELLEIGGYDDARFHFAADTAAWIQLAERFGRVALCHETVADYMVHDANETVTSSQSKWLAALDGIGLAVASLQYPSQRARRTMLSDFEMYRARAIVRTQSDAAAGSGPSLSGLASSARIVVSQTKRVPPYKRAYLCLRWFARVFVQAFRNRLRRTSLS